jgi:hypothetical protein
MQSCSAAVRIARTIGVTGSVILLLVGTAAGGDAGVPVGAPEPAATPGVNESTAAAGMQRFVGKWLFTEGDPGDAPGANEMTLRMAEGMLVGKAGKNNDTIVFTLFDGHRVKGTLTDSKGEQTPVHATLSSDGSQLILELRPPFSEIMSVVALRAEPEGSAQSGTQPPPSGTINDPVGAQAELDKATAAYRRMVEQGETAGIEQARARYQTALENMKRLKSAASHPRQTPPAAATPAPPLPGAKTENDAIEMVAKQAEVAAWIKQVAAARRNDPGRSSAFRATDNGKTWEVQAFENVRNADGGHTATFGWYSVDKASGQVSKMRMDAP